MKVSDFLRLKKLMMLAANNTNDPEAIRAFRAATEIVRAHGYTWEQVMDRRVTVLSAVEAGDENESSAPETRRENKLTEDDFETAMEGAKGSFLEMLESIYEQWESGRKLSPRQIQVVLNARDR